MINFEECPNCHIQGRRKTLAVYEDGHKYCFFCSLYKPGNKIAALKASLEKEDGIIKLPYDSSKVIPKDIAQWLGTYDITRMDVLYHNIQWSEQNKFLIFPYYSDTRELLGWQGRDFKPNPKSKWYSQGNLKDIFHVLGNFNERKVVLVEDIISCIKLSHFTNCLCLFGSSPPDSVIARIRTFYDYCDVWLDPDAHSKAVKVKYKLEMIGVKSRVILSERDPKETSEEQIKKFLTA